ncbi:MAG: hypothetical protein GY737_08220 [Desulfobacteraceae bacterium]|nr:hypothetical protein [Desulfobacteraceae bacterium]
MESEIDAQITHAGPDYSSYTVARLKNGHIKISPCSPYQLNPSIPPGEFGMPPALARAIAGSITTLLGDAL